MRLEVGGKRLLYMVIGNDVAVAFGEQAPDDSTAYHSRPASDVDFGVFVHNV